MTIMLADHFYRVMLAIAATAALACISTVYGATAGLRDRSSAEVAIMSTADVGADSGCSARGWPYYDAHCTRGLRLQHGRRVPTRIIAPEDW